MKVYLLKRECSGPARDVYNGFLLRAATEEDAREMANTMCADEGPIWHNKELTSCEALTHSGEEEVLLTDFNAG